MELAMVNDDKQFGPFVDDPPRYVVVQPFSTSYLSPLKGEPCTYGGKCDLVEGDVLKRVTSNPAGDGIFHPDDQAAFADKWVDQELRELPAFWGCGLILEQSVIEQHLKRLG